MKLIDKDKVTAEIKRRIDMINENAAFYSSSSEHDYLCRIQEKVYKDLLSFLDTIEEKEVDLEKELERLDNTLFDLDGVAVQGATYYLTVEDVKDIAKRFYEMGLNTRKGE